MTESSEERKLSDLLARTRALPRDIAPPADAWAAIQAEMNKPNVETAPIKSLRIWQRPAFLIAAGFALIAASSLVTMQAMKNKMNATPQRQATVESPKRTGEAGPSTFAEFASVENDYISSANQLSAVLESERSTLSPETIAKLRQSLAIIDAAIIEARRALAADPANRALVDMLKTSYNQKIDLLKRTTEMGQS